MDSKKQEELSNAIPFDEALAQAKFGKLNYFVIFVSGIIITYALIETVAIGYVLPVSKCDLNLTSVQKGVLGAIAFTGAIVSAQFWGFLSDTMGRRKMLIPALFLAFISSSLSSLAGQYWVLVLLRFCAGFFGSGGSAIIYSYLGEIHTNKRRSRAIMIASFIFGIAFAILPIKAWLVINQDWALEIPFLGITYKPWRFFLVACGLPGLFSSICFLFLPESPKFLLTQGREKEAIDVLQRIYSINTGQRKDNYKVHSLIDEEADSRIKTVFDKNYPMKSLFRSLYNQTAPLFKKNYIRKTILVCTIQFGVFSTGNGLYVWFPGIVNQVIHFMNLNPNNSTKICEIVYSNVETAQVFHNSTECNEKLELSTYTYSLILEIFIMIGFGVMGFIIDRIGPILILFVVLVITGLCGIAIVPVNIPLLSIFLFMALLLSGLGITVVNAATVELYPTQFRSMAVCISIMAGRLGGLAGSNAVGILIENYCEAAFILSGVLLIICGCLAFMIPMPKKAVEKGNNDQQVVEKYVENSEQHI